MKNHLIGITGTRGSGKTTAANILIKKYDYGEYSFARPLKLICQILFHLNDDQVFGDYKIKEIIDERWNLTPRQILQRFGTEFGRNAFHDMFPEIDMERGTLWVYLFKLYISSYIKTGGKVVVADVRFPNEAKIIKELGGIMLKIERPGLTLSNDIHASETEMEKIEPDYVIVGEEGVKNLQRQVLEWHEKEIMGQ